MAVSGRKDRSQTGKFVVQQMRRGREDREWNSLLQERGSAILVIWVVWVDGFRGGSECNVNRITLHSLIYHFLIIPCGSVKSV